MRFKSANHEETVDTDDIDDSSLTLKSNKVMILSSRGITSRYRHLLNDLVSLLPTSKKDNKFDSKSELHFLNELSDLSNCNHVLYFEARKHEDLYLWISKTPEGPSIKFNVLNVHTMDELHFTGNCIQKCRPYLSFDDAFNSSNELLLMKEMLTQVFGVEEGHKKSQPYADHIFQFALLDNKIWFRNYQIVSGNANDKDDITLVEIGPRFVLDPIRIFEGSFEGRTIYKNETFLSPNEVRRLHRQADSHKYLQRTLSQENQQFRRQEANLPKEELSLIYNN